MNISDIDSNFAITTTQQGEHIKWLDVRKEPFEIYGLYNAQTEPVFKRMPDDVAASVNGGVKTLYLNTAGGRVRFSTDSPFISVKAILPSTCAMPHMTVLGSSGFDLYHDTDDGKSIYHRSYTPSLEPHKGYENTISTNLSGMHSFTLNFPLYNPVDELYIGLADGCTVTQGKQYTHKTPVVYYGSSITQGGCASRPGNSYQSIISRELNTDYINLGFSGNALGEDVMAEYIASLDMSVFVCDYDHNAPNADHLKNTHRRFYELFRKEKPDVPFIIVTRPDADVYPETVKKRFDVIRQTYEYALESGDKNVRFVDGSKLFGTKMRDCCTVDGCHPNDLGFSRMAEGIGAAVAEFIK